MNEKIRTGSSFVVTVGWNIHTVTAYRRAQWQAKFLWNSDT